MQYLFSKKLWWRPRLTILRLQVYLCCFYHTLSTKFGTGTYYQSGDHKFSDILPNQNFVFREMLIIKNVLQHSKRPVRIVNKKIFSAYFKFYTIRYHLPVQVLDLPILKYYKDSRNFFLNIKMLKEHLLLIPS